MSAAPAAELSSLLLDVPFVPQTEHLCGGAALSMVLRYWGERDVYAEDWAPLVRGGGIPTEELRRAAEGRGFVAHTFAATWVDIQEHLAKGRPLIALVEVAPGRHHYVVAIGSSGPNVVFHDPAAGPWRVWSPRRWMTASRPTQGWTLLLLPSGPRPTPALADLSTISGPDSSATSGACGALVEAGIDDARAGDTVKAEQHLLSAVSLCPERADPIRELAGLRFQAGQYYDAVRLATEATRLEPQNDFGWRLLGTSLFLTGETPAALDAWNHVGEPRLDEVHLTGLTRTRVQAIYEHLGLTPREVLASRTLTRAERRVFDLPSIAAARTAVEPRTGGIASLRIAVVERALLPQPAALAGRLALDALVDRSSRLTVTSPTGSGESLDLDLRWWTGRPAVSFRVVEPGAMGLPGLVGAQAFWERQTFGSEDSSQRETRIGGTVSVADWWLPSFHAALSMGVERWEGRGTALPLGVDVEQRLFTDRLALRASGTRWLRSPASHGFGSAGFLVAARTSRSLRRVEASLTAGVTGVTSDAPLSVWPGAGEGHARPYLLRAHALVSDGSVSGPAFGRGLAHMSAEFGTRGVTLGPVSCGAAVFLDVARPWMQPDSNSWGPSLVSAGGGLRLRLPGLAGTLRADVAWESARGKPVFSAGWKRRWPDLPAAIR